MSDIDPNETQGMDMSDDELNNTFDSTYDQEDELDANKITNELGEIIDGSPKKGESPEERPIKLSLFTRQQVIKNISTMFPNDVQEMISSDMQKFSDMITNFNLRFDACTEMQSNEKLTILTQANYMSNILLNMYPFSINEPCMRALILNNFRVLIDENIPINT